MDSKKAKNSKFDYFLILDVNSENNSFIKGNLVERVFFDFADFKII